MTNIQKRKIVIIGAGHVGSHCGYSIMLRNGADELVYLDTDTEKARMQAQDQDDASSLLAHRVRVRAGTYADCADAQIVVMAAGVSRQPGQTRLDMFDSSIAIMNRIVVPLKASGFNGILISISNPADIVADFLRKRLDLPKAQVFSTGTSLDSARLRRILSEILGVDRRSIQAYSMGEHGDSQMIPASHIFVGGVPIRDYAAAQPELLQKLDFGAICRQDCASGCDIVDGKGCTEFGIGMVCADLVQAIFNDERRILPVSTLLEGEYGQTGVHAGVPAVIGKNGVEQILEIDLTPEEQKAFAHSCDVIRGFLARADQL
ncbi:MULTISPECIES: L-lactate dehydrogenase [Caproicibacterium]|uniref:L-lactate dehydrogenase n=1 Tax=Caproicibacterium argilliputei TaxID=3030016 RepID=A0AA97DBH9_9FIRM|nr:L-lactate dehydrogenase [Caproicibacterium argilliputei]WOC32707.1 L-lactate dehydrogenase [Caproicibacterium argilliputei]